MEQEEWGSCKLKIPKSRFSEKSTAQKVTQIILAGKLKTKKVILVGVSYKLFQKK